MSSKFLKKHLQAISKRGTRIRLQKPLKNGEKGVRPVKNTFKGLFSGGGKKFRV